jgi:hypothetical protein
MKYVRKEILWQVYGPELDPRGLENQNQPRTEDKI